MSFRTGSSALACALLFSLSLPLSGCGETTANPIGGGGSTSSITTSTTTTTSTGSGGETMGTGGNPPSGDCDAPCGADEVCVAGACHGLVALDTANAAGGSGCTIVFDADNVYWTNGEVRRVAKGGGPSTLLDFLTEAPGGLAVDDTHLFWISLSVLRADKTSPGKPGTTAGEPFADEAGAPTRLVGDGATLYYLGDGMIYEVPMSAAPAPQAPPVVFSPTWSLGSNAPIAVDDSSVYFWSEAASLLTRQPKTDGPSTTLATKAGGHVDETCAIVPDGAHVYYSTAPVPGGGSVVARVGVAGGEQATVIVDRELGALGSFAVDASDVYFMTPAAVMKVPKGGGEPVLVSKLDPPSAFTTCMAADDTYVYWVEGARLMRYAK